MEGLPSAELVLSAVSSSEHQNYHLGGRHHAEARALIKRSQQWRSSKLSPPQRLLRMSDRPVEPILESPDLPEQDAQQPPSFKHKQHEERNGLPYDSPSHHDDLSHVRMAIASILQAGVSLSRGKIIHQHIISFGMAGDTFLGNLLVNLYSKAGALQDAWDAFQNISEPNVVSWTSIITAYDQQGRSNYALLLYEQMQFDGVEPNKVTFITILRACANLLNLSQGKEIHAEIVCSGYELDVSVANALVTMYSKCGAVEEARDVFDEMRNRNVISWTALISGYIQKKSAKDALLLFNQMQRQGIMANRITYVEILGACADSVALAEGKAIHQCILDENWESDLMVGTALVNMYGKCGALQDAHNVFVKLRQPDVVLWNAMIYAYAHHGNAKDAFQLYKDMQQRGVVPTKITLVNILRSCASAAALEEGKFIHDCIMKHGFVPDIVVESALVNMYGKCGAVEEAFSVFDHMHQRSLVSWNSMVAAYAQYGHIKGALRLLSKMEQEHIKPDRVTFVSILSACSHAGLVKQGCLTFVCMVKEHGLMPLLEHYSCMLDLFARVGKLEEAEDLIDTMPLQSDECIWRTLLGACRQLGDVERAHRTGKFLFRLKSQCSAPYILMSNVYTADSQREDVADSQREDVADMGA